MGGFGQFRDIRLSSFLRVSIRSGDTVRVRSIDRGMVKVKFYRTNHRGQLPLLRKIRNALFHLKNSNFSFFLKLRNLRFNQEPVVDFRKNEMNEQRKPIHSFI